MATHEDEQLVNLVREGDPVALGALYEKYRTPVFQTALAVTRDRGSAESVLRQCFDDLRDRVARLDAGQPLARWLYRNALDLSCVRLRRPALGWPKLDEVLDRLDRLARLDPSPATRDLQDRIQHLVESLPHGQRAVLMLYYLGGLRLKEIARVLGVPLGTVKSRLHYGRRALRARFEIHDSLRGEP